MQLSHRAGGTLFVDYASQGESYAAALCIAVLGTSSYSCAEANRLQVISSRLRLTPCLSSKPALLPITGSGALCLGIDLCIQRLPPQWKHINT